MPERSGAVLLGWALLAATCGPAGADEVDELARRLRPPARFAQHRARFSVSKQPFTFHHVGGPKKEVFRVLRDGDRFVALMTPGGTFHLLAFRPQDAPSKLAMPTGRWHIDTLLGTCMATDAFLPGPIKESDASYQFTGEGTDTLKLVRHFEGKRTVQRKREHRKKGESKYEHVVETIDTTNTFVLRCDPIHGYTIDGTFDSAVDPAPDDKQFVNLISQGTYAVWPGQATSYRTVITPVRKAGYEGWYNNLAAIDRCDNHRPRIRDGGFAAYLNDETGWSAAMAIAGATARVVVCNAHADVDFVVPWPEQARPDARHPSRLVLRHRLVALPPELTHYVWQHMDVLFKGQHSTTLRIGSKEDFEDQPLELTTRVRGLINTVSLKISTQHARSGSKSMVVKGRTWPNLPQIALQPGSSYRLEAWMMSEDPNASLYITGHLYEWSPHSGVWLVKQQTNTVKGSQGWQRVVLEFTTPQWDPFINIVFCADGGTGYLDDFSLVKLHGP